MPRFSPTSMHVTAVWRWQGAPRDTQCVICDNPFEMTCNQCKEPGIECPPAFGKCGHTFHLHCIGKWLNRTAPKNSNATCPICRGEWIFLAETIKEGQNDHLGKDDGIHVDADSS
ncbi:putative anaphase promoting complex subunit 11 [Cardiosporidium cionae]|uniref:Anaphase promoting complex subunit 11 n=1 Tax=Cardiosporidium cionae TaxID=476202 RepID=A0ABQ7J852_9APIC|nr:putative anaphase promoting complex subunit 11 [Cardiosporidium cionae]|eukprot:KAF8820176.1 putative anaphase promoting complex subunit 11 [Cardiosporidium cionae]